MNGGGRRRLILLVAALVAGGASVRGAALGRGQSTTGEPGVATARATVDFSFLAAQEARAPRPLVQVVPQPEVDTPVDVPLDDELRALLPKPELAGPLAPLSEAPTAFSPVPANDFLAAPDNMSFIPPDTHGAAGPNHLMVTLNGEVRVLTKTGTLVSSMSLNGFWSAVSGLSGTFDPRVTYDPVANRWIVSACDDPQSATSGLLVGVSRTSDPTGLWNLYKFDADAANLLWYDYPSLGFTKDWIVVQVNAFTIAGNTFSESDVFAFNKADLYAGGLGLNTLFKVPGASIGSTQVPALTYDSTLATAYLVKNWNSAAGALQIFTITGPVGSEAFTVTNQVLSPQGWNPNGPKAPQLGLPDLIATNDARMQSIVYRNGSLWAAQTVFPTSGPSRASVQWWQFLPSGSLLQRARVDDLSGSTFYAFPSIAVSANDDVLVGYSRFSATQFASANYSFRFRNDAPSTLQSDLQFKAGQGGYEKYFGGTENRWGDYSNTVVDPTNDRDLWTIQEFAGTPVGVPPNSGRWGTWWARVATTPTLSINDVSLAEGNVGTVSATFTVTLSRAVLQTVKVDFATADDTALVLDGDYVATSGQLTFNPGETSKPVVVVVNGDSKFEPNETFFVNLTNPQNADLADDQGLGTIVNDDAQPTISVNDVTVVEGDSGTTRADFTVSLSNPSSQTIFVFYQTQDVTAMAPTDYTFQSGSISFSPGGFLTATVSVLVNGDTTVEPEETFQFVLFGPINATIARGTGVGTILNDDIPSDAVQFFTVTSKPGQNRLEWVNPSSGLYVGTVIRYKLSNPGTSDCTPPTSTTGGDGGFPAQGVPTPGPGGRDFVDHLSLAPDTTVCYTAFVQKDVAGTVFSAGISNRGRPFNPGAVKWALNMGIFSMIPPGNGVGVVHAVGQDGSLHSMVKGDAVPESGTWPNTPLFPFAWKPNRMGGPSQGRPSGIPVATIGSRRTIFLSSQDGHVYAFNAETGALAWMSAPLALPAALQAHPSGALTIFGASRDFVFVGTRESTGSRFYALNVNDGTPAWAAPFDGVSGGFGRIGPISGQAAVDQVTRRVYFASREFSGTENNTVWCVNLETGAGIWAAAHGDIDAGVSFAGTRIVVGTNDGKVKNIDTVFPSEGVQAWSFTIPGVNNPVKGYVAVDRISGNVFFSTINRVWALNSDGTPHWLPMGDRSLGSPSTPVYAPLDLFVYVGGGDGKLHRLSVASGAEDITGPFPVPLGDLGAAVAAVGSPTYDLRGGFLYVGTENGVVYAVLVP